MNNIETSNQIIWTNNDNTYANYWTTTTSTDLSYTYNNYNNYWNVVYTPYPMEVTIDCIKLKEHLSKIRHRTFLMCIEYDNDDVLEEYLNDLYISIYIEIEDIVSDESNIWLMPKDVHSIITEACNYIFNHCIDEIQEDIQDILKFKEEMTWL